MSDTAGAGGNGHETVPMAGTPIKEPKKGLPKLSIEGALGIAAGVILFILDKMGIGGTGVYVVLFILAMGLCVDSIIRSEWADSKKRKAWGGIGMSVFYLAFGYWIFLRPHKKTETESNPPTITHESGPTKAGALIGEIEEEHTADETDHGKRAISIYLILGIRNSGEPTVVDNYKVGVETVDGRRFAVDPTVLPSRPILDKSRNNAVYTFQPGDGIYEKTTTTPIAKGGKAIGWILGKFPQLTRKDFENPGARFSVSFRDVSGNEYTATATQRLPFAQNDDEEYHPGAAPRFYVPPRAKEVDKPLKDSIASLCDELEQWVEKKQKTSPGMYVVEPQMSQRVIEEQQARIAAYNKEVGKEFFDKYAPRVSRITSKLKDCGISTHAIDARLQMTDGIPTQAVLLIVMDLRGIAQTMPDTCR